MSGTVEVAIALAVAWLGVLTLAVMLVIRQMALFNARLQFAGRVGDAGPIIGSRVPESAVAAMPELDRDLLYLLFVSATCGPCRETVIELAAMRRNEMDGNVVALLAGHDDLSESFAVIVPPWIRLIRDPSATDVARALDVSATPFLVNVENGVVTGKAYVRSADDVLRMMEVRPRSDASEMARTVREVVDGVS